MTKKGGHHIVRMHRELHRGQASLKMKRIRIEVKQKFYWVAVGLICLLKLLCQDFSLWQFDLFYVKGNGSWRLTLHLE